MADLVCAGFGGQGVLTAGLILAKTGMNNGKNVTWIPSYGSEMRGGTANCNVKISDKKIGSPFIKNIDILVAMNVPSVEKFEKALNKDATIVVNSSMIKDYKFREDINVYCVEATEIAEKEENLKGANIVMLGALAATAVLFDKKITLDGIEEFFAAKGKNNPKNEACFLRGFESVKKITSH